MYNVNIEKILNEVTYIVRSRVEAGFIRGYVDYLTPMIINIAVEAINNHDPDLDLPEKVDLILKDMEDGKDISFLFFQLISDTAAEIYSNLILLGFDTRLKYSVRETFNLGIPVYSVVMNLDKTFMEFKPITNEELEAKNFQEVSDNPSLEQLNELYGRN